MTTSINISSCFENPQSALVSAFQRKNIDAFKYALEHLHADPNLIDSRFEKSIFEKILETPQSSDFIILCIDNGADLYLKNNRGRYPIHAAIDSLCPENLKTFLKFYDTAKINVKYGNTGSKNCLHVLVDMLPNGDYEKIAQCIKILVNNGCDPNIPNEKSRTPFFSLLKVQPKLSNQNELVDFMLDNCEIDVYTYKHDEMKRMFEKQNPHRKLPEKVEKTVDVDFMLSLLRSSKHVDFEVNFKQFKDNSTKKQNSAANDDNKSNNFAENCAKFLYTAVQNDLENVVELLLAEKVDVNKIAADASSKKPPAFLACCYGYHRMVDMIMQADPKPETTFENRSLLHEVCRNFGMEGKKKPSVNFQKCFELVVDACDVNVKDDQGCTPLHYAVRYQNDDAVKALLERSSYIGSENGFGETPIDDINREVFEDFLNSRIVTNVRRSGDEEQEIMIDYNFLKAPKLFKTQDEYRSEIAPLHTIANNSELRPLILHPVLSSFLFLKWSKLSLLFYGNLLLFSTFMVSLIVYIVLCQSIPVDDRDESGAYSFFFILSVISIVVLMIREFFQCILSPKSYFKSLTNWFEIALIILGWIVLFKPNEPGSDESTQRSVRALLILCAAYEFLQLVGTLPILSISTHMVILKKVGVTFLKSIALYSIVLFAFAFSFFTLFGGQKSEEKEETTVKSVDDKSQICCKNEDENDEYNSFGYPGIAIIKTFVMLTGEFDASDLHLEQHPFYSVIFILFVFVVTIVLFNLLNALAVDDTQVIKSEGQLVDLCQRIDVLYKYEKIILSRSGSWRWLKSIISIFPYTIPRGKIVIRPNKGNEILLMRSRQSSRDVSIKIEDGQEQELQNLNNNSSLDKIIPGYRKLNLEKYSAMDPKIMKKIRCVLEERSEKHSKEQREESLMNRIRSMESQLKILTDLMMKQKSS